MEKKIGIITIIDYGNFGNRLQNYATQEVLKKFGYTPVSIKNKVLNSSSDNITLFDKLKDRNIKDMLLSIINKVKNNKNAKLIKLRKERFVEFTNRNIFESNYIISSDQIPNDLSDGFEYFVTGSDQIWNPDFRNASPIDFLEFAPKEKRVAFSPSFGISAIPVQYLTKYTTWLTEMHALSVREEAGAQIIKDLTGREAEVLVDPTLMLSRDEWLKIANEPKGKPKQKYLLTYFLGEIGDEKKSWIEKIAKESNLEVVNLLDTKNKDIYVVDPSEFIDLINTASLMCTDSFHGSIFSIIMETPFIIFDRIEKGESKMSSRIDTLLRIMKLENRHFNRISNKDDIFQADFTHTDEIILNERIKVSEYLTSAFS